MPPYDAVVIGAGPAGLTAATYLARYRRPVLVLDGGRARAAWIPETHNTPGFPSGIDGPGLLQRFRDQAQRYGAQVAQGLAREVSRVAQGFRVVTSQGPVEARAVLLATGVLDRLPAIPGLDEAIRSGVARLCPICDGYEAIGRRIAVLGDGAVAEREAEFLRTYTDDVTVLRLDSPEPAAPGARPVALGDLAFRGARLEVRSPTQELEAFDHIYLALGCAPQSQLAVACGARIDEAGALLVDAHQMTSVEGFYAAGDLVRGLNQIAVATGEAAIAATAIHNRLRAA